MTSADGDGLQAQNGTLTARNDTVIAPAGDASHALSSFMIDLRPRHNRRLNMIARGAVDASGRTGHDRYRASVSRRRDRHRSLEFVTSSRITDQGHNQSGNPLFAGPSDFHLLPGSPAIDAGVNDPADGPTDLDGHARIQGTAPDLGAYEAMPIRSRGARTHADALGPRGRRPACPQAATTSVDRAPRRRSAACR